MKKIKCSFILYFTLVVKLSTCEKECNPSESTHHGSLLTSKNVENQCAKDLLPTKTPKIPPTPLPPITNDNEIVEIDFTNTIPTECKRMMVSKNSSQTSVLANFGNGRLGNQMCNFASQYTLHKEYEVLSYFSKSSLNILKDAFQLPRSSGRNSSYYKWNDKCIKARDIDWAYISNAQLIQPKKTKTTF